MKCRDYMFPILHDLPSMHLQHSTTTWIIFSYFVSSPLCFKSWVASSKLRTYPLWVGACLIHSMRHFLGIWNRFLVLSLYKEVTLNVKLKLNNILYCTRMLKQTHEREFELWRVVLSFTSLFVSEKGDTIQMKHTHYTMWCRHWEH